VERRGHIVNNDNDFTFFEKLYTGPGYKLKGLKKLAPESLTEIAAEPAPEVAPEVAKPKKKWNLLNITETLTPDQWSSLSEKAKWDSIVALRGPDLINSEGLKWFTSSVIRHRLSKVMRVGGLVNQHLGFVVLPDGGYSTAETKPFDIGHFLNHVQEAACWLGIPVVYVAQETFGLLLKRGYSSRAEVLKEVLKVADKGSFVWKSASAQLGLNQEEVSE
jgi:hypothetical protein